MRAVELGKNLKNPHLKKVRVLMKGSEFLIGDEIDRLYDFSLEAGNNLFGQISELELDLWVNVETGDIFVDGAQ